MTDVPTLIEEIAVVGDSVVKVGGYAFPGIVLAKFETLQGKQRLVVEHSEIPGLLHIFRPEQLALDERGKLYALRLAKNPNQARS